MCQGLSLDLLTSAQPHFSCVHLQQLLAAYDGQPEELEGLVCSRCTWEATQRRSALAPMAMAHLLGGHYVCCGSLSGLWRLNGLPSSTSAEALEVLRPCWAPAVVLQRRRHTRSYRIEVAPRSFLLGSEA